MTHELLIIFGGALAGGFVSGLIGYGTGLTAIGIWLYVVSPPVAAFLVIICSVVSQLQTLPMIWHAIEWRRALPFIVAGLMGVPVGTGLLSFIDLNSFKTIVGYFLIVYSAYSLFGRRIGTAWGGRVMDCIAGFGGGLLGGLAGLSGPTVVVWTDVRGYGKARRRAILQPFNLSILTAALISHAATGLITRDLALTAAMALPGTICGAWVGAAVYRQLVDHSFQKVVMAMLFVSGSLLVWTSL